MNKRTYPPCMLVVNDIEYILTDVNERRVKERLYELYKPETIVEEWVDGNHTDTYKLQDIFNE